MTLRKPAPRRNSRARLGPPDSLIVGGANVVYERGGKHSAAIL